MDDHALWSCGVLGKAHGLHGELYLKPGPRGLDYLSLGTTFFVACRGAEGAEDLRPCAVTRVGGTDQRPLVRLDIADDRDAARALTGGELFAAGAELDELPGWRVRDLVGLRVETAGGRALGEVVDVLETPAHELLEVGEPGGATRLVPLVEELVEIDLEAGVARVVDGLLDGADA